MEWICLIGLLFVAIEVYLGEPDEKEREKEKKLEQRKAELKNKGIPHCSKCGSTYITTISESSGWLITVHRRYNICQNCGHKTRID